MADYNGAVIGALQDVADALATRNAAAEQEQASADARDQSARAYDIAMKRYKGALATTSTR